MIILYESPVGYLLIDVTAEKDLKLLARRDFESQIEALENYCELNSQKIPEILKKFLGDFLPKDKTKLYLTDSAMKQVFMSELGVECEYDDVMVRLIRSKLFEIIDIKKDDYLLKLVSLAHKSSHITLKGKFDNLDGIIIESINMLDELDKDINLHVMRIKEWYSFHFPELEHVLEDNREYVEAVSLIGKRENAENNLKTSSLSAEKIQDIIDRSKISMGTDVLDIDCDRIIENALNVLKMFSYRNSLSSYINSKINEIAPNLTVLVGELVASKLIAKAGSLYALSKLPGSTLQIMGSEKAYFTAIKEKSNTPKYGFIYHSPLVVMCQPKNKGKIARSLASKASLACKIDVFGENVNNEIGLEAKNKLELRVKQLEGMATKRKNVNARPKGFAGDNDSTRNSKRAKINK